MKSKTVTVKIVMLKTSKINPTLQSTYCFGYKIIAASIGTSSLGYIFDIRTQENRIKHKRHKQRSVLFKQIMQEKYYKKCTKETFACL